MINIPATPPKLTDGDIPGIMFDIQQLFTPSTPIRLADLFAGRRKEIHQLISAVAEPGRHAILHGERGVGKTSLSQVLKHLVPSGTQTVSQLRKSCSPGDNFESIWRKFFKDIGFEHRSDGTSIDQLYPELISPDDVVRELKHFPANDIPIFVIDEFNEISDSGTTASLLANTMKALSDEGASVTLIVVGVGDSVAQLFEEHGSIERCTEEVLMPRMTQTELTEILDKRLTSLGMTIEEDARWKIVILSRGLPTYVHSLGKYSATSAVVDLRRQILESDVDYAIDTILTSSLESLRVAYEKATFSNQPGNLFKEILLSCALVKPDDDSGYFAPAAVLEPLEKVLGKPMSISQYRNHLSEFSTDKRGKILQRHGQERGFRYRFQDPRMLPYVLMNGIKNKMIPEAAKNLLRFPAQGQLFQIR